jgi:hypothetical protein
MVTTLPTVSAISYLKNCAMGPSRALRRAGDVILLGGKRALSSRVSISM